MKKITEDLSMNASSEEEEDEEEEDSDSDSDSDSEYYSDSEDMKAMMKVMGIRTGEEDEVFLRPCCEKCQHLEQSYGGQKVTPEKLSRGRLQAQLEGPGTYECELTGLIFEASERVLVGYSVLSWRKFNDFVQNPWTIAGPIFNVHTIDKDASVLKSIQLPHSLCLADQEKEKVLIFGALHVTGKDPVIEKVQYSGSHVKWPVSSSSSSLSPVGAIARDAQEVENHGEALLYEDLQVANAHLFHVYLTTCNSSHVKDVRRSVKKRQRYSLVDVDASCLLVENKYRLTSEPSGEIDPPDVRRSVKKRQRYSLVDVDASCLLVENKYRLTSEPSGEIDPPYLPFTLQAIMFRGFFEAYYEQPPPFTFSLKAYGSHVPAWTATIQEDDLLGKKLQQLLLLDPLQQGPSD